MKELTIFLSAVTDEFRSYRDDLRRALTRPNVSVKVQDDFIGMGTTTLEKLDTYIRNCDAVVQLIGGMTGSMAGAAAVADIRSRYPDLSTRLAPLGQALDVGTPLSYTQWEAYLAVYHRKTLLLAKAEPVSADEASAADDLKQAALQVAHVARLEALERFVELRFKDASELVIGVYRSDIYNELLAATGLARAAVESETMRRDYAAAVVDRFCRLDRVGFSVSGADDEPLAARDAFAGQRFSHADDGTAAVLRIDDVVRTERFVIVAAGGAGKSSVLKQILARAADGAPPRVPVFVSLGGLAATGPVSIGSFMDYLAHQAASELGLRGAGREFFETILSEGNALLGFDALDEGGSLTLRQQLRQLIVDAATKWPECRIIVTSRREALSLTPLRRSTSLKSKSGVPFVIYDLAPFRKEDIAPFLEVAFDDDGSLKDEILRRTDLDALTETPLTLTLLALVARAGGGLPSNLTDLFASCVNTVTSTWEENKRTHEADPTAESRNEVLQSLGWAAQCLGVDALEAHEVRAAIMEYTELRAGSLATSALDWLSRRSVLLRPEIEPGASTDLRRLTFRHPQFREYLAGARLAEWLRTDPLRARAHLSEHCLDADWLGALQFFLGSIRREPEAIDAAFEAIWNADRFRDLLQRPAFVLGRLLAGLDEFAVDSTWVERIVQTLEQLAREEPALSESAAQALLDLWRLPAAVTIIERWTVGILPQALIDPTMGSRVSGSRALKWRLRAIESLASARGFGAALQGLATIQASDPEDVLAVRAAQARFGDTAAAAALLRQFQDAPADRRRIAAIMDEIGATGEMNRWISDQLADADGPDIWTAIVARERGLLQDTSPHWPRLLEQASAALAGRRRTDEFAPTDLTEAAYVSEALYEAIRLPAARELLKESLGHRALIWFSARVVMRLMPDLGEAVIHALAAYIMAEDVEVRDRGTESRYAGALSYLAAIPDHERIVPVFLQLLGRMDLLGRVWHSVAGLLRDRGRAAEALMVVRPQIAVPSGIDDAHPDGFAERRSRALLAAELLSPGATVAWLETAYRRGNDQVANAQQLASTWKVSGLGTVGVSRMKRRATLSVADPSRLLDRGAVALGWFKRIVSDPGGRTFLEALTVHAGETTLGEIARRALQSPPTEEAAASASTDPPEPTLPELESQFEAFLSAKDEAALSEMTVLEGIRDLGGDELATRYASIWLKGEPTGDTYQDASSASVLAERLLSLSAADLRDPSWLDLAADTARRLPPAQRVKLIEWMRENVS